ncbi:MAG TPA: heat-inducible transcription repressor HrcA [Acholeplasmataceae bacterium]|jgi:heat-inducible transcriptional repressor|nr:heat-inducible transcription repressor HrcA [Acholeplasmataceae bacterium]
MLSERQKLVLKAIVEEYVQSNEPVGSKSLVNVYGLNVSSATIRNDMAFMEQQGLIEKTHSSSGRIPSENGYRYYVQMILSEREQEVKSFPLIDQIFRRHISSREEAIKESMSLVAELTNYATIVLGSQSHNSRIKKIQLVALDESRAVVLIVTNHGYVESKKILIPEYLNIRDLEKVCLILNDILKECLITDIDKTIKAQLSDGKIRAYLDYYDELVSTFVRIFTEMVQDKYFLTGQSNILSLPEFQDVGKVKEFLNAIENQEILKVVETSTDRITVRIGQENTVQALKDCTVITVPYELDDGKRGAIAVLGPTRMEYQKIIPLLEYIAENIKKVV